MHGISEYVGSVEKGKIADLVLWGAYGKARANTCITFVSRAAYENGIQEELGLEKLVLPVKNCRTVGKKNMILNDATPDIQVDPDTYMVKIDGVQVDSKPSETLPLSRRYYLF